MFSVQFGAKLCLKIVQKYKTLKQKLMLNEIKIYMRIL